MKIFRLITGQIPDMKKISKKSWTAFQNFLQKNAKLSKLTFKTFIDILRKNEEQAKILYIYDVNLNIG